MTATLIALFVAVGLLAATVTVLLLAQPRLNPDYHWQQSDDDAWQTYLTRENTTDN